MLEGGVTAANGKDVAFTRYGARVDGDLGLLDFLVDTMR